MKKIIFYISLTVFVFSCSKKLELVYCDNFDDCDPEFCYDFQNALIQIQLSTQGYNIPHYVVQQSTIYLSVVTGLEANVIDWERPGYIHYSDMKKDIEKWINWYNLNHCKMSKSLADSLVRVSPSRNGP